jgi:hypothetical protein
MAFSLALPSGQTFRAGTQEVLRVRFQALPGEALFVTKVRLIDEPVSVLVSSAEANRLPVATVDGMVMASSGSVGLLESISREGADAVKLRFAGAAGSWELQSSADLRHWKKVADMENSAGFVEFVDKISAREGTRFYRALKR